MKHQSDSLVFWAFENEKRDITNVSFVNTKLSVQATYHDLFYYTVMQPHDKSERDTV